MVYDFDENVFVLKLKSHDENYKLYTTLYDICKDFRRGYDTHATTLKIQDSPAKRRRRWYTEVKYIKYYKQ